VSGKVNVTLYMVGGVTQRQHLWAYQQRYSTLSTVSSWTVDCLSEYIVLLRNQPLGQVRLASLLDFKEPSTCFAEGKGRNVTCAGNTV